MRHRLEKTWLPITDAVYRPYESPKMGYGTYSATDRGLFLTTGGCQEHHRKSRWGRTRIEKSLLARICCTMASGQ